MKEKLDSLIGIAGVPYETAGLFYLLAVIGMWRIFKKAGEAGCGQPSTGGTVQPGNEQ